MTRRRLAAISGTVAALAGAGAFAVATADRTAEPSREAAAAPATQTARAPYRLVKVAGNLGDALYVTYAPGQPNVLFIVQQSGKILRFARGRVQGTFLDVSGRIASGNERGLLGLAFHPDFKSNGRFFVNYTNTDGDTRVVEFSAPGNRTKADPDSAKEILAVEQPYANHNGGMVAFGRDGKLYIGLGDGGSGGDPEDRAQNLGTLLGKILRIDVDAGSPYRVPADNPFRSTAGAEGEIWYYGLRNPWRFSFDRANGDMWIGDVGQGAIEEVDYVRGGRGGLNFGWNAFEGRSRYGGGSLRGPAGHTPPVAQYTHAKGISITGGYVYRGRAVPALRGRYIFGDFGTGRIWSMRAGPRPGGLREETARLRVRVSSITSFGEGTGAELYMIAGGSLYRFAR
ncbi:MAG: PQQ-dependent sugar dehydrogenase [Thermoleophilia bacterium]|nr:PQQ-dependent sugar dehydrogenase [Thermoleophilia bacterium]